MTSDVNGRASKFIAIAENLFGAMTSDWKYRGVEFYDLHPHLAYYPEHAEVAISLSFKARDDELQRDFQLAHEVCHLLYPARDVETQTDPKIIVLNEGVSTYFSLYILNSEHGSEAAFFASENIVTNSPNYFSAFEQVMSLLERDESAVKKLRKTQPKLNDVKSSDFHAAGLSLSEREINSLLAYF